MTRIDVVILRWALPLAIGVIAHDASAQVMRPPVPVQRYGWETPEGPSGNAARAQVRAGGAMLSRVADMAEGQDGALYVLDGDLVKVVVFNRNGSLRRIIGNGRGEGPGEFIGPNSLAVSETGDVFVLDLRLARVTIFDTTGVVKRTVPLGLSGLLQVRVDNDHMYILNAVVRAAPVVRVYDLAGHFLDARFMPSAEDLRYGRTGNGYRMAQLRDGRWVLGHPNPGAWSPLESPTTVLGRPLVVNNTVRPVRGNTIFEAYAVLRGLGELADGRMLALYEQRSDAWVAHPENAETSMWLGVLRPDSSVAERFAIPDAGQRLLVSRTGSEFYVPVNEPFPQVVRYRLP